MEDKILWDENHRNMPDWAKEIDFFFVENNILCRAQAPTSEKRKPFIHRQVVMPLSLRKSLVEEYHNSALSGHLAYRRTFQKLKDKYYLPSMLNDIREYCQKCEECARQKRSKNRATLLSLLTCGGTIRETWFRLCGTNTPHFVRGE